MLQQPKLLNDPTTFLQTCVIMYLSCCTFQPPYTFTYLIVSTQTSLPLDVTDGIDYWFCVLFKIFNSECVAAVSSRVGACQVKTTHAQISQVWRWTPLKIILMKKTTFKAYLRSYVPTGLSLKNVIKLFQFKVKMSISISRLDNLIFLTWRTTFILCFVSISSIWEMFYVAPVWCCVRHKTNIHLLLRGQENKHMLTVSHSG